jgi:hypothetical protein
MIDSRDQAAKNQRYLYLGDALISLIFVSKLTLAFTHLIPYHIPPFIYQGGMHPYINILSTVALAVVFFFYAKKKTIDFNGKIYIASIIGIVSLLMIQTILQMFFVHEAASKIFQLTGAIMAFFTLIIFGVLIPVHYPLERFIKVVLFWCVSIVFISLFLLPLFHANMFRGGRFIGITKHIPHMVSISTLAAIFLLGKWPLIFKHRLPFVLSYIAATLLCILTVALTATKAAMGSVVLATFLALFYVGRKTKTEQWGRFFILASLSFSVVLLTPVLGETLYEIASGERALLGRPAQNGFETRWEEVVRGSELFRESPALGLGIMYKFMTHSLDGSIDTYNSFKDPHNLFLSAGVIAGWPFMIAITIGYLALIFKTFYLFMHRQYYEQSVMIASLFLVTHLPVFLIYHVHLSLGGIADRIYWCLTGYILLARPFLHSPLTKPGPDSRTPQAPKSRGSQHEEDYRDVKVSHA